MGNRREESPVLYDVVIAGAGPAGLSAALTLGRARRRVVVFDTGRPRNLASRGMHGYLSRDGILPSDFLALGRKELGGYGVEFHAEEITSACAAGREFAAVTAGGATYRARKLLIATGLVDRLPSLPGIREAFGRSVFHCPYCDGWEVRDRPLGVLGRRRPAIELAVALRQWSGEVTLLSNGPGRVTGSERALLAKHEVRIREAQVAAFREPAEGMLEVEFRDRSAMALRALFVTYGYDQHSSLAHQLGCSFTQKGVVRTDRYQETSTRGVYVVGDAARDMQMVVVAAAEGAKAAVAINKALLAEDI